jgi:hypothetical protein
MAEANEVNLPDDLGLFSRTYPWRRSLVLDDLDSDHQVRTGCCSEGDRAAAAAGIWWRRKDNARSSDSTRARLQSNLPSNYRDDISNIVKVY